HGRKLLCCGEGEHVIEGEFRQDGGDKAQIHTHVWRAAGFAAASALPLWLDATSWPNTALFLGINVMDACPSMIFCVSSVSNIAREMSASCEIFCNAAPTI